MVRFTAAPPTSILVLLLLSLISLPAWSQQPSAQDAQTAKFQLAEAYLRAGQFERAAGLFEDLLRSDPTSYVFFDKLRTTYVSLKRYDDAIRLVEDRMESGATPDLLAEKGTLLFQKGDEEAAFEAWDAAVALMPDNPGAYRVVYMALVESRLFERAITLLEDGRVTLRDPLAFRTDLSYLYGLMGEHAKAMQEYVSLLTENPRQLTFVKRRIGRFSEQDSVMPASIVVAERAVRNEPLNRALRELTGWLYMENGQYRNALNAFRAIDRLESEDGRVLFAFARTAADAGAFDAALEAYQEILDRHADAPTAPSALFGLAEMHERQGELTGERAFDATGNRIPAPHFDQALETYRTFLQNYPGDPRYPEALQRIGRLQQQVFYDFGAATAILSQVANRYAQTEAAARAQFDLGQIALQRGDLREARLVFARLEDELEIGELAERARYEMALIDYYTGQFESASTIVSALDANTSTDIANDAIALKVLLNENKGPDSLNTPLNLYARAQLLRRQRRPLQALDRLDSLLSSIPMHALLDETRFERAAALRDLGQPDSALAAYREVVRLFPASYLADRSLFAIAEIYERDLGDKAEALEAYSALLVSYPGSLLAPEVRARIRKLRGDGV